MSLSKIHRDYLSWVISEDGIVSAIAFNDQREQLPKINSRHVGAKIEARQARKRGDMKAWARWMNSAKFWKAEQRLAAFIVHLVMWQRGQTKTPPDPILD